MRYYKIVSDGIIMGIGTGAGGTEITQTEYESILTAIRSKPATEPGIDYHLTESLVWEPYEVEIPDPEDEEPTAEEVLSILLGGEA